MVGFRQSTSWFRMIVFRILILKPFLNLPFFIWVEAYKVLVDGVESLIPKVSGWRLGATKSVNYAIIGLNS